MTSKPNFRVGKDANVDVIRSNRYNILPVRPVSDNIYPPTMTPVQGAIAYDSIRNEIWYGDGLLWRPVCCLDGGCIPFANRRLLSSDVTDVDTWTLLVNGGISGNWYPVNLDTFAGNAGFASGPGIQITETDVSTYSINIDFSGQVLHDGLVSISFSINDVVSSTSVSSTFASANTLFHLSLTSTAPLDENDIVKMNIKYDDVNPPNPVVISEYSAQITITKLCGI